MGRTATFDRWWTLTGQHLPDMRSVELPDMLVQGLPCRSCEGASVIGQC
jgi:hypothetical protein